MKGGEREGTMATSHTMGNKRKNNKLRQQTEGAHNKQAEQRTEWGGRREEEAHKNHQDPNPGMHHPE